MTHGWSLCEAKVQIPKDLLQRIVSCYITTVYYASVAMVGKRFLTAEEVVKVDAWKFAFSEEELLDAFRFLFCDALPLDHEQIIRDEIAKHPLRGVSPATIPLSTSKAVEHWQECAEKFSDLEDEVSGWVSDNIVKLPFAEPAFRFGRGQSSDEEDNKGNDYF